MQIAFMYLYLKAGIPDVQIFFMIMIIDIIRALLHNAKSSLFPTKMIDKYWLRRYCHHHHPRAERELDLRRTYEFNSLAAAAEE